MFSSKGDISSKRIISFMFSIFAIWAGVYIVIHYKEYALTVFGYTLIIIGLLTGIFTLPEILSIIRPNNNITQPKEDEPKKESL